MYFYTTLLTFIVIIFLFKKEIVLYYERYRQRKIAELRRQVRASKKVGPKFIRTISVKLSTPTEKDKSLIASVYEINGKGWSFVEDTKREVDLNALKENQIVFIGPTLKI